MSKQNPTTGERMAVIENDIKAIKTQNIDQYALLGKIEGKLDTVMLNKADKVEVVRADEMTNQRISRMQQFINRVMVGLVILLLGILGFLIKFTLYN